MLSDADFEGYDNGNKEPKRGFGHVAFMVDDVYAASEAVSILKIVCAAIRNHPTNSLRRRVANFKRNLTKEK